MNDTIRQKILSASFPSLFHRANSESVEDQYKSANPNNSTPSTPRTDTVEEDEQIVHPLNDNSFDTGFEPAQYADIDATNENILASVRATEVSATTGLNTPMSTYERISTQECIHDKEASTDSAVCEAPKETFSEQENELTDVSINSLKLEENEEEVVPTSSHENEVVAEKEKPQRTINRRKKDSGPVSRNSSCVSTDSTTSTATVDSGIAMRLDSSPRSSPISSDQYFNSKDLSTSRETLDDDVKALEESEMNSSMNYYRNTDSLQSSLLLGDNAHCFDASPNDIEDLDTEKVKRANCCLIFACLSGTEICVE